MEPVSHIRELLYHHDCVVVPGFGGFVTNQRAARIDRASGIFYPPSRVVGFNARIDHNDGLLISQISSRLSMNYVDVKKLVDSFVEKVKDRLVAGRTVHFEGIGQFVVDRDHNLQFEPDPAANFLTEAYGLSFFRCPDPASRGKTGKLTTAAREERSPLRAGMSKMLRYAAVGIPLAAALAWGAMNTGAIREFNFNITSLNPFSAVIDSGSGPAASLENTPGPGVYSGPGLHGDTTAPAGDGLFAGTTDREGDDVTAGEQAVTPAPDAESATPAPPPEAPTVAVRSHYLVAGSFLREANAISLGRQLAVDGYDTSIIESENGMYRVSMYSSRNRREALQMLRRVRAERGSSEIWMLSM
jgi:nucleoid DNA-binding protein